MPPGLPHAAEPENNSELRQIREDRAGGSELAGFVIPSRTASMRLRSRRSARRCSSDRRFSRNKILASSAARAQTGRWRAVMQALGHRVRSGAGAPERLLDYPEEAARDGNKMDTPLW